MLAAENSKYWHKIKGLLGINDFGMPVNFVLGEVITSVIDVEHVAQSLQEYSVNLNLNVLTDVEMFEVPAGEAYDLVYIYSNGTVGGTKLKVEPYLGASLIELSGTLVATPQFLFMTPFFPLEEGGKLYWMGTNNAGDASVAKAVIYYRRRLQRGW